MPCPKRPSTFLRVWFYLGRVHVGPFCFVTIPLLLRGLSAQCQQSRRRRGPVETQHQDASESVLAPLHTCLFRVRAVLCPGAGENLLGSIPLSTILGVHRNKGSVI